jgi:hypothetical protein
MNTELINLPLEIQTALAGGYLAYWVAYVGIDEQRRSLDVVFRTFAFGLPAVWAFRAALPHGELLALITGVSAAVLLGCLWRWFGRQLSLKAQHRLKVHQEDGIASAWTALIQQKDMKVSQLSVHTADGRVLIQNSHSFPEAHLGGLYFGSDGSIVMVVEEEELPDGTEEMRQGVRDADWGTRVTYIPADQITRVNIR